MDQASLVLSLSELSTAIGALQEPHTDPEVTHARLILALKLHLSTSANLTSSEPHCNVSIGGDFVPQTSQNILSALLPTAWTTSATSGFDSPAPAINPAWTVREANFGLPSPSPTPSPSRPWPLAQWPSTPLAAVTWPSASLQEPMPIAGFRSSSPLSSSPQMPLPPSALPPLLVPPWPLESEQLLPLRLPCGLQTEHMPFVGNSMGDPLNDQGSEGSAPRRRGSTEELERWLRGDLPPDGAHGNGQGPGYAGGHPGGGGGGGGGDDDDDEDDEDDDHDGPGGGPPPPPPPPPPPLPPFLPVVDPWCPRGGLRARLLRDAAGRTRAEAQQHRQWNLEERYLQQPNPEQDEDAQAQEQSEQPPDTTIEEVDGSVAGSAPSAVSLYPHASHVPVAEEPAWGDDMRQLILAVLSMAKTCLPCIHPVTHKKGVTNPDEVLKFIVGGSFTGPVTQGAQSQLSTPQPSFPNTSEPLMDSTLQNIVLTVKRCAASEIKDAIVQLSYWLNSIKLACLLNKYLKENQVSSITSVWASIETYVRPARSTFDRYVTDGVYACRLAGAGSMYFLVLMACARVRPQLRKLRGNACGSLAKFIRCPTDSAFGILVKKELIPAIAYLRVTYPLRVSLFFPTAFLQSFAVDPELDCTDLMRTDMFFDSIYLYNDFTKGRDWDSWIECAGFVTGSSYSLNTVEELPMNQEPLVGSLPEKVTEVPISEPAEPLEFMHTDSFQPYPNTEPPIDFGDITLLDTNYNPALQFNKKLIFKRTDKLDRWQVTEQERAYARQPSHPKDLEQFKKMLQKQLQNGYKKGRKKYLYFDSRRLDAGIFCMRDINQKLSWAVCTNMPDDLKSTLFPKLETIYPKALKITNTADEGLDNAFPSCHFTYWFRYGKKGHNTPSGADVSTLQKEGKQPVNTSQNIPRESRELKENSAEYQMFIDALGPVFQWIKQLVKQLLPDTFESLSYLVSLLPNGDTSPVDPFAGFVVNINVSTRIHRDWGDEDICLVLVLSDCIGGELCLVEPGVVLAMQTGDVVIFKSAEISHFNLHYSGKRASLVFHTDRAARSWAKDRDGWDRNVFMPTMKSRIPDFEL